jgi:hypothetical protein
MQQVSRLFHAILVPALLAGCADALPEVPAEYLRSCQAEVLCGGEPSLVLRIEECAPDVDDVAGRLGENCDAAAHRLCPGVGGCEASCDPRPDLPCL